MQNQQKECFGSRGKDDHGRRDQTHRRTTAGAAQQSRLDARGPGLPSRYVDEHPVTIGVGQAAGEPRTPHPLTRQLGISLDDLVTPAASDPRVRRPSIHRNGMVIVPLAPEGAPIATYKITYPPV